MASINQVITITGQILENTQTFGNLWYIEIEIIACGVFFAYTDKLEEEDRNRLLIHSYVQLQVEICHNDEAGPFGQVLEVLTVQDTPILSGISI